ncbi:MAG: HEPN domain-containing protein [Candidatus Schekmanbacteria bacterium]|nr:HEPN domain-containing protein [Candidatus Schekmanbacteria bacterium]
MKEEVKALIKYRLERAYESLDEAKLLLEQEHANTFVNRLYYACFYAVSALFVMNGLSSSKHSGVRSLFHKNFVKSALIEQELGKFYDRLFNRRQKGDYADFVRFDVSEVSDWYEKAKEFVETIELLIKKNSQ